MDKKNKLILTFIIIGLFILISLFLVWRYANRRELENESARIEVKEGEYGKEGIEKEGIEDESKFPSARGDRGVSDLEVKKLSAEQIEEQNLKAMALAFVERYGSFSNDSNYDNFSSLKIQATDEMRKVIDEEVRKLKILNPPVPPPRGGDELNDSMNSPLIKGGKGDSSNSPLTKGGKGDSSNGFYGVTTKVLSVNVKEKSESAAILNANCQKREEIGGESKISYEEVEVEMVKEGERWLISYIREKR